MDNLAALYHRIYKLHTIEVLIESWRRHCEKIVFTNGCFDILHKGHVEYLHQAAGWGTKLIVGLNSDDSVKRLKGNNRPLQNEQSRAVTLAALRVVDAVCVFDDDTPIKLIEMISPDFLIKGGDYQVEEIAGYEFVTGKGGKVLTIPLVDGYSTTNILQKF